MITMFIQPSVMWKLESEYMSCVRGPVLNAIDMLLP